MVACIRSQSDVLNPRVYFSEGRGYNESNTFTVEPNRSFVIIADIGRLGMIKAMRIDPASYPCEFDFTVEMYSTREAAEHIISDRLSSDMAGATVWDIGRLRRFYVPMPNIRRKTAKSDTAKFIAAHYSLAKSVPALVPDEGIWLSVVVPVYNASERYLDDLVRSFEEQKIPGTELILSDDASTSHETVEWYKKRALDSNMHVVVNEANGGIASATNLGLSKAQGTWVAFLDHDDMIAPHAFKMILKTLLDNRQLEFLYTDEVVVDDKLMPLGLMLKPAYDPVLLTGVNYINHFSIFRRDRLKELGYLRSGFDGSQDYDMLLRYLEGIPTENVLHLPYPAYWWRRSNQSYSQRFLDKATKAARTAISDRFDREGRSVTVTEALTKSLHKVDFLQSVECQWPKISVIIPSRNGYQLINVILDGLYNRTDYNNFEVIIVDNGSTDDRVLDLYDVYRRKYDNFVVEMKDESFNFSRAVNKGISMALGDHYLILNNDIEIVDDGWLKEMVSCFEFASTGIVGAKLLYPNGRIQHAGVIVGLGGFAGHWYLNKPSDFGGPMNRLHLRNSVTCVTGAAMLISRECAEATGEWDEINFAVAYNDVDYCLRARAKGFGIIWTPFASLKHHESATRGSDLTREHQARFSREKENLRKLYSTNVFHDPTSNPGYGRWTSVPSLETPTDIAEPRCSKISIPI
ncbi:hypothetical protein RRU01S_22_00020 [Agrobacterium rubi TR3 = NBRC 13261]|uniref:Glycosyltransferase 2-like domain-containing protein n=1 Tax=Agrobacterium rubi TR3 = NBRC 13261 TaxID=1368415 RepID=A0A081CYX3_9HYPH|nr:hypothetical protein RRU01S_22_00020 [Agrobacterium rubi TR3 = NBRC 13261]